MNNVAMNVNTQPILGVANKFFWQVDATQESLDTFTARYAEMSRGVQHPLGGTEAHSEVGWRAALASCVVSMCTD